MGVDMRLRRYTAEWWEYLTANSKYQGLDLLRAIAITVVVLWHFDSTMFRTGWTGVNLFFILSGFLIGTILLKAFEAARFSYWGYLTSRFLRIYPLYIVVVAFYLFHMHARGFVTDPESLLAIAALQASFLPTLAYDFWGLQLPYYAVTWSLVVEIAFYITIPVILFVLFKLRIVWVGLLVLAGAFLWLRFGIASTLNPDDPNWHFVYFLRPYFRYDELLYGVAVAYAVHRRYGALRWTFLVAGLVGLAIISHYIWHIPKADQYPSMALMTWESVVFPTLLAAIFAAIVYGVYDKRWSCTPVNAIARLAYPLYLTHYLIIPLSFGWTSYLLFSLAASVVTSFAIEYPFIRLYKNRREQAAVSAGTPLSPA
ncbi:acyltransferase [Achromobacter animicus]|uniref:acyltransferase family protein n=1 Tax=Achromobacter animicus TaxID=1389935 RepID=UPI0028B0F7F8|nr:acyltransferase [Achromobacter animicus]